MKERLYLHIQSISLQVLGLLFFMIFLIQVFNLDIEYYINFGTVSLIASIVLAYSSYKTLNNVRTRFIVKYLFFFSGSLIIISNLFFFDILSQYHPIFYSILLGQILLFPFILKNGSYGINTESKERKIENNKKNRKSDSMKDGRRYVLISILLIFIIILSFYLRLFNADVISPGRDSLHHYIGALSINDNGSIIYTTLPYINHLLAFIFENIGQTLLLGRLPFIIAGTLSVLLVYFIGKKISNSVGIISALLLGICPWAIGLSRYVRDYSLNIFYELFFITLLLYYPKDIKKFKGLVQFILLNIVIYVPFIIFARYQTGLTISIIIALLVTTSIRVFAELDLYERIKLFNFKSREFNYLMHAAIFSLFIVVLIIYIFEFDNRLILTYQPKWFFFFLSESRLPILWYSFMEVPWYFILSLTLLPILGKPKDKYVWTSFLIFYAYLIFFVFLAKPHTSLLYARYVYPALPFFIILLGVSISYIFWMAVNFTKRKTFKVVYFLFVFILLAGVFNFNNTIIGSTGKTFENSSMQVISVPYRDYSELVSFLGNNGFSKEDIVIASELRMKDTLAWYFDFDFYERRNASSFNTYEYDIADNIHVLNEDSYKVMEIYDNGWIVRRDGDRFPKSISLRDEENVDSVDELKILGIEIEYLGLYSDKYEVYTWSKNDTK
ncbi:MAG: hypothetical protein PF569_02625 [Candidatus Woesearchaeota archaeon]|jgi:hypothetical protein|nr:hypothetical protein [Candidatus Woesearchaeota archaeon]